MTLKLKWIWYPFDKFLITLSPLVFWLPYCIRHIEFRELTNNWWKQILDLGIGYSRKSVVDALRKLYINGWALRALGPSKEWEYLGVTFAASDRKKSLLSEKVLSLLDKLTQAPLKPQQRLFVIKVFVFPKCYHMMKLERVNVDELNQVDKNIRASRIYF